MNERFPAHGSYFTPIRWMEISLILCLLALSTPSRAADGTVRFDAANKLYELGKYSEAVASYQELIQAGQISAAVYFNLGNAYFKSGHTGQAIVAYRIANQLDPRDPDIRANLRFARESVQGATPPLRPWERWIKLLTLNELTLAASALVSLWFLVLAVGEFRRERVRSLRPYKLVFGVGAGIALIWLGLAVKTRLTADSAVVITNEGTVRYGPFQEAQSFYTLRDGSEVTVLNRKDDWLHVADRSNRTGWIEAKQVSILPPG